MQTIIFLIINIIAKIHGTTTSNCTKLPQSIAPEKCCDFPRLFNEAAIDYCLPSINDGQQCVFECIYAATELCRKRECDVRKADDYVDYVKLENKAFNAVYKQAYRECMKEVSELDNSRFKDEKCDPQPELIEICVHNKMFTLCPTQHFHADIAECAQERDFLQNCIKT